jgi:hypothetical protein
MDRFLHIVVGGLAGIGLFMIGGYLHSRKRPEGERAELFWFYAHIFIKQIGISFLVLAIAVLAYEVYREIVREFW